MDYDIEDRLSAAEDLAPISQGGSGQLIRIKTPVTGTFNPATDTTTTGSPGTQYGAGIEESYSAYSVAQGLVQAGDKKFMLSALKFTSTGALMSPVVALVKPVADRDTVTLADGSKWLIKRVETLGPAGTAIFYELQLRTR